MWRNSTVLSRIFTALITFVIGVTVTTLWNVLPQARLKPLEVRQQNAGPSIASHSSIPRLSICDLYNEPGFYENKLVTLEGDLYATDERFVLYGNCPNINYGAGLPLVGLEISGSQGSFDILDTVKGQEVSARVIGAVKRDQGAEHLQLLVVPLRIELLSAPRKFKPRGAG